MTNVSVGFNSSAKILSPFAQNSGLERNPEAKNKGKFISLGEFLGFAKTKPVQGVLINIEVSYIIIN